MFRLVKEKQQIITQDITVFSTSSFVSEDRN